MVVVVVSVALVFASQARASLELGSLPSCLGDLAREFESDALSSKPLFKSPKQTIQVSDMCDFRKVSSSTKKALLWHKVSYRVCMRVSGGEEDR